jgi:YHS domain-containing protein
MLKRKMIAGLILALVFSFFTVSNAQSEESVKEKNKPEMQQGEQNHKKVNDDKALEKPWNEVCPVRGGKVQKETALVEYTDKQYGFCCPGCDSKFKKDPEKYSKNLSEDGKKFIGKK